MDDPIGRAIENAQNAIVEASTEITRLRVGLDAMKKERDAARAKALEDAAVKVESLWAYRTCAEVATAIRAMKEPTK